MRRIREIIICLLLLSVMFGCAFEQAWHIEPNNSAFSSGRAAFLSCKFDESMRYFDLASKSAPEPSVGLSFYWLGMGALYAGNYQKAGAAFQRALDFNPPAWWKSRAFIGYGRSMLGLYRFDDAERYFDKALETVGGEIEVDYTMLEAGLARIRGEKWEDGMKIFEEIVRKYPGTTASARAEATLKYRDMRGFTVQSGAFGVKSSAEREVSRLKEKGLDARVFEVPDGKGGVLYTVCIGRYRSFRVAQTELERFRGLGFITDAVVRP